jgi:hypothetical protein
MVPAIAVTWGWRDDAAGEAVSLTDYTRERVPLQWATTQNNLGNALWTFGQRESGTARLEEAIATWEACLIVVASVWPPDWVQYVRDHRDEAQSEIKRRSAT